jgi:osmotically-inducible protein OsmY
LFKGDPGMASITGNVEAKVHHGFVTLRGTVPTENDRELIKSRVSRLPGVVQVNDELGINLR